jgi:predicted PurR-regulated permease PerM
MFEELNVVGACRLTYPGQALPTEILKDLSQYFQSYNETYTHICLNKCSKKMVTLFLSFLIFSLLSFFFLLFELES